MEFTFKYYEKEYILNNDNLEYFENDEVNPLDDINEEKVIEILNNAENVEFSKAYFDLLCSKCKAGVEEKKKFFDFLELNFYIYAKDGKFVISTLDKKYEGLSYNKLQKSGKVNQSYIVIIDVCKNCGNYSIEIEEFEI
ncbi:MAG: DUF3785 family protein [Clostridium sp.]|uniref:DUF3785 family protein n=1 Tax=Clostridium sp. TaxID=1506 RepID=UPI003995F2B3